MVSSDAWNPDVHRIVEDYHLFCEGRWIPKKGAKVGFC